MLFLTSCITLLRTLQYLIQNDLLLIITIPAVCVCVYVCSLLLRSQGYSLCNPTILVSACTFVFDWKTIFEVI
jgi:hypothetical protein